MREEFDPLYAYEPFPDWEPEIDDETVVEAEWEAVPEPVWADPADTDAYEEPDWEYAPESLSPRSRPPRRRTVAAPAPVWEDDPPQPAPVRTRAGAGLEALTLAVACIIILLTAGMIWSVFGPVAPKNGTPTTEFQGVGGGVQPTATAVPPNLILPYDEFTLTQGIHGQSYGHMAIDLAAGAGAVIKSPLTGQVTELFTDPVGNTVLVLEDDQYRVTLLHGEYFVRLGENVRQGEPVGYESNIGYTTDMAGNRCTTAACGHHTHLNIYDKTLGSNINAMAYFGLIGN